MDLLSDQQISYFCNSNLVRLEIRLFSLQISPQTRTLYDTAALKNPMICFSETKVIIYYSLRIKQFHSFGTAVRVTRTLSL
jgi:hypothetical protein